jgi:hypothetical protein
MAGSAPVPQKRGRPVGSKDSYQRMRWGVGEPTKAPRLPRAGLLRLVPPPATEPVPERPAAIEEAATAAPGSIARPSTVCATRPGAASSTPW